MCEYQTIVELPLYCGKCKTETMVEMQEYYEEQEEESYYSDEDEDERNE